jgi:hypothetical protein
MISFVLGVEDLADTRFALSPLHETLFTCPGAGLCSANSARLTLIC